MKLLSVLTARSSWWGHISDFNPKGINWFPLIVTFLSQTYNFKNFPDPTKSPPTGEAWKFEYGSFTVAEGEIPVAVGLTIFSDSIAADTPSSTNQADAFLSDMFTRFSEILKLPDYNEIIGRRTYLSALYVSTDKSLQAINPKLNKFATLLSQSFEQTKPVFEYGGISFWADPAKGGPLESFNFERAATVSFAENRYFSRAPLPTDKHLELLDKLENILG